MSSATKDSELTDTGLAHLGHVPWGEHICLFCDSTSDLLGVVVPFLAAGLRAGELCVWLRPDPSIEAEGVDLLRSHQPDVERYLAEARLEIIPAEVEFRGEGQFNAGVTIAKWDERHDRVRSEGFSGLRISGDLGWVAEGDREALHAYERSLQGNLRGKRSLVLCTYPLRTSPAITVLNAARTHDMVIVLHQGRWETLETPGMIRAKHQIQLTRTRRKTRERVLRARFAAALEERRRLSREIHDTLLQGVAGIAMQLRASLPHVDRGSPVQDRMRRIVELAESTIRSARRAVWDMRVDAVARVGLHLALDEEVRRAAPEVERHFQLAGSPRALPPDTEDAIFRIGAEALANVAKHAGARRVSVVLDYRSREIRLTVIDDGHGFEEPMPFRAGAGHWGLLGMRERADSIGASLDVRSAVGEGTTVELRVPVGTEVASERIPRESQRRESAHSS